ncbi:MAG: tetratricopeptide repeat protein, partial [Rhodospirillaceae bacterium]|nr:tetratricopeptide repeat protein [Rhodospirillaceae bacterium]
MTGAPSVPQLEAEARRLFGLGQLAPAAQIAAHILKAQPKNGFGLNLLGAIAMRQGQKDQALAHFARVVELYPKTAETRQNYANALAHFQQPDLAIAQYVELVRTAPKVVQYQYALGALYLQTGDLSKARQYLEQAWRLDPKNETTALALSDVYRRQNAFTDDERLTAQTTALWPARPVHWLRRAEALFGLGRFAEGWAAYRWRLKDSNRPVVSRAVAGLPLWSGEDISGKSVLLFSEQGPGDELLYGSFIPDIVPLVGQLSVLCSARIAPLFQRSFPTIKVYGDTVPAETLAGIDVQAPILDFAEKIRPTAESFSNKAAYAKADAAKAADLRAKYRDGSDDLLIGIAWRSLGVEGAAEKTISLGVWGPIFGLPGVRFVNLQYGDCKDDLGKIEQEYKAHVIADEAIDPLVDLDAYAAQVAAMDLVISSSNTAAHVAGALGVACDCMLPFGPLQGRRWYWQPQEGQSLWYAAVRLFTKADGAAWGDVIRAVTLDTAEKLLAAQGTEDSKQRDEIASYLWRLMKAYQSAEQDDAAEAVLMVLAKIAGHEFLACIELAQLIKKHERYDDARAYLDQALLHKPNNPHALNFKGMLATAQRNYAEAERNYRLAMAADPTIGQIYSNLGSAVHNQGRGLEAHDYYKRAHELLPDSTEVLQNLAVNLMEIDRPDEAVSYFDRLLAVAPDHADGHAGRAFALLTAGRFAEGWPEMWWREKSIINKQRPPDDLPPRWSGQSFAGASVLVWTEYGLGDELLALTMLPDLVAVAGKITLICTARLVKLLARSFPSVRVIERAEQDALDLSAFDFQMSLSELGAAFRPTLDHFPSQNIFLRANPKRQEALRRKYTARRKPVVGVSWVSGNPKVGDLKSLPLSELAAGIISAQSPDAGAKDAAAKDASANDATIVSLQYGYHEPEITQVNKALGINIVLDNEIDAIREMDG